MKINKFGKNKPCLLNSAFFPLILFLFFALIYLINFAFYKNQLISSIEIEKDGLIDFFEKFGGYFGFIIGFVILLLIYFFYTIKKLFGMKNVYILNPILNLFGYGIIVLFAQHLLYQEPRYTDEAISIIEFIGNPLYFASKIIVYICIFWLILYLIKFIINKYHTGK